MSSFISDTYNPKSNSAQRPVDREETTNDVPLWEWFGRMLSEITFYHSTLKSPL